ncbi:MAG: primosomal protein N' [Thermoflexibacter sp.]|nr:primosomal protein N' [Thermoflexibacter sp.]
MLFEEEIIPDNTDLKGAKKVTFFADVILPVPVEGRFTYRIPAELNEKVKEGARVVVNFGKRRVLTGIVMRVHQEASLTHQAKYLLELLDEIPIVNPSQLRFWEWIADYYMCYLGEVMNVALPSGLKLSSLSKVQLNPNFGILQENYQIPLAAKEQILIDNLQNDNALTFEQIGSLLNIKNIYPIIKSLLFKEAIIVFEELKEKYKPKIIKKIRLSKHYINDLERLTELLDSLNTAKRGATKQQDVILKYLSEISIDSPTSHHQQGLPKSSFIKVGISESSLHSLIKKGVFEEFEEIVSRFQEYDSEPLKEISLNDYQKDVIGQIENIFDEKQIVLLHGITGSGKTEMYIDLVNKTLAQGKQVLFLLPEIALTTQIVNRLKKVFGVKLGVYHSRFSDNERVEVWKGVQEGKFPMVAGVRSSIFLPFDNLGLIIVDEEHDSSYKQYDPAPRYNARDTALVLAHIHQAKVLLGSATPSLESYYQAQHKKYGFVVANKRFGDAQLPEIKLVNMSTERKQKTLKYNFSSLMLGAMEENLQKKEQIILFQNRRGFAPHLICEECSWIPTCINCAVSLTFHLASNELRCHYCGYREAPPASCLNCSSTRIKTVGFGTEKIEDELRLIYPEIAVQRMDLDTTRSKYSYQTIIEDFANQQIDVLIGTQMVTKGLDFDHVSLVGIFDIDRLIHFPDFRSHERTFQLLTQVSGRAGRKDKKGMVLIQTAKPQHSLLDRVINHNYEGFYEDEILEREKHFYPPFSRLINITIKAEEQTLAIEAGKELSQKLKAILGEGRVLGPVPAIIEKIRNQYLQNVMIKLERDKINLKVVKQAIKEQMINLTSNKKYKTLYIVPDVDPM